MTTDANVYITTMKAAIADTDGTFANSYDKFEELLVTTPEAVIVWDCFELQIKRTQVKRYYDNAAWEIAQADRREEQPEPAAEPTLEPAGAEKPAPQAEQVVIPPKVDMSRELARLKQESNTALTTLAGQVTPPGRRGPRGVQKTMEILGAAEYDRYTDHRGNQLGNLTRNGLELYIAREASVAMRYFAKLLRDNMPMTTRTRDVVRNYIDRKLSAKLWQQAQEAATAPAE